MRYTFNRLYKVYRLVKTEADDKKEEYELSHTIKGYDTPISAEDIILTEGNPAKSHKFYSDPKTDIKESDKIVKFNEILGVDEEFIVKGIRVFTFGSLSRVEAVIELLQN